MFGFLALTSWIILLEFKGQFNFHVCALHHSHCALNSLPHPPSQLRSLRAFIDSKIRFSCWFIFTRSSNRYGVIGHQWSQYSGGSYPTQEQAWKNGGMGHQNPLQIICRGRPWCHGSTLQTCGANPEKIPRKPPKPITDYENNVFIVFLKNI